MPLLKKNNLALTCGLGISAEITQKAWAALKHDDTLSFFVVGRVENFAQAKAIGSPDEAREVFPHFLPVLPLETHADPASCALRSLEVACDLVLEGQAAALVTNPVNKALLAKVGFRYAGQTEFLAAQTKSAAVMMLATNSLRCALVTTHLPLREVPDALTTDKIIQDGKILYAALQTQFGLAAPKIGVAALNPHASDDGLLGSEEKDIIAPACAALNALCGERSFSPPLPADSLFTRKNFDAFLCMYHDQALIAIKMQADEAVNITLGLPIVRTSPDHGTAFDIVGKDIARPASLLEAIKRADNMAR